MLELLPAGRTLLSALEGGPGKQDPALRVQRNEIHTELEMREMVTGRHCPHLDVTNGQKSG